MSKKMKSKAHKIQNVRKAPKAQKVQKKIVAKTKAVKPAMKLPAVKVQPIKVPAPVKAQAPMQKPVMKPQPAPVVPANNQKMSYKVGHYVVYPTHGVGRITAQETQMIGDVEIRMLVIGFEKDKMTLRVPMHRAAAAGLRPISTTDHIKKVMITLKAKARTSRGMWSRRAQEYEAKINSGSVISVAEVVRDLHQNVDQSERSYSERMIYENALARLVGELAAAEGSDHKTATDKLMKLLRGKVAAAAAAAAAKAA